MRTVDDKTYAQVRSGFKTYELDLGDAIKTIKGDSKFFGMEIGDSVMVLQMWNNDFCTASFRIPNSHIIGYNGKYTVVSNNLAIKEEMERVRETADLLDVPSVPSMTEPDPQKDKTGEASIEARLKNIGSAVTNDFNIKAPVKPMPKPRETIIEAAKEVVQVNIPTNDKPVITRGKQKPEESKSETPQREIVRRDRPQQPMQTYKPAPQSKPEQEPEPKPVSSFGNW